MRVVTDALQALAAGALLALGDGGLWVSRGSCTLTSHSLSYFRGVASCPLFGSALGLSFFLDTVSRVSSL